MNKEKTDEMGLRRKLFKLFDKGKAIPQILKLIPRSRAWVYKWQARYRREGTRAAQGKQRTPHHSPQAYPKKIMRLVRNVRQRLQRETVGLTGAKAIRRVLQRGRLVPKLPSLSTIHRILKSAAEPVPTARHSQASYYPAPQLQPAYCFHSMDWMLRYLKGGAKVFIFHTIDLQTHALAQTLTQNKRVESALRHALTVWQELGLPDFLQIDNDAAFTGLGKKGRIFGHFVRLALHFGIEIIFIPPAEAKRNHLVEGVNHLFARSFWEKTEFQSVREVERKRGKFLTWYQTYEPPALLGLNIREANQKVKRRKLKKKEIEAVPEKLPLTKGRIHFLRQVSATGEIEILKERWKVSRRLAGRYVCATVNTARQSLQIYYRAKESTTLQLLKEYDYRVGEKVVPLQACYCRAPRALRVQNLF